MRSNRKALILMIIVALCLTGVLMVNGKKYSARIQAGEAKKAALEEELADEQARTEDIQELQEYMQSDEYKEQVAKEKLGLIEDDEIIFKESE